MSKTLERAQPEKNNLHYQATELVINWQIKLGKPFDFQVSCYLRPVLADRAG